MHRSLARVISICGHPLVVLPLALVLPAVSDPDRGHGWAPVAGTLTLAGIIMLWSRLQVRRGRWRHIDASRTRERQALNRFLLIVLTLATTAALWVGHYPLGLDLALSALIVLLAILSARVCTLSLHAAFAVFSAVLLLRWSWLAGGAVLLSTALVVWSRLELARHTWSDIRAGLAAGSASGVVSWWLSPWIAAN